MCIRQSCHSLSVLSRLKMHSIRDCRHFPRGSTRASYQLVGVDVGISFGLKTDEHDNIHDGKKKENNQKKKTPAS